MNLPPEVSAALIAGLFVIANQYYQHWLRKRASKPDLADPEYPDLIEHITREIQAELGAHRVQYWAAQNGESTLDGHSIKKLSMVVENNAEGVDNVILEMQNIPSVAFKRNIDLMRKSNGYIYSEESEYSDTLAKTYRAYGIQTGYFFKVNNLKKKMWTGILVVAFDEKKNELCDTQLGWLQMQLNRIEGIILKI